MVCGKHRDFPDCDWLLVCERIRRVAEILMEASILWGNQSQDEKKTIKALNGATMESNKEKSQSNKKKAFFHLKGITYFDKKTERAFFFVLTLIMLCLGVLVKFGVF